MSGHIFCRIIIVFLFVFTTLPAHSEERGPTGNIKVGIFPFEPFNYIDSDGIAEGFYPDLLRKIVKDEKWQIEFIECNWSQCLDYLQKQEIDLMVSVAYSSERAETMDYSYESVADLWGQVFIRPEGDSKNINDLEGKRIGVMRKDISASNFITTTKELGIHSDIIEFATHSDVFKAVQQKIVEAGVAPQHYGLRHTKEYNLVGSTILFSPFSIYFASKKGTQHELLSHIDSHISGWKKDKNSYYYERLNFWFGGSNSSFKTPFWLIYSGSIALFIIIAFAGFNFLLRRTVKKRTMELAQSEANLLEAQEIATLGRWEINLETNQIIWSDSIYTLLEIDRDTFTPNYELFFDFIHPDDRTLLDQVFRDSVENKIPYTLEHRLLMKDGRIKWVNEIGRTEYSDDGRPVRTVGTVQNITERKLAEEILKTDLELNRAIANISKELLSESYDIKKVSDAVLDAARSITGSEHGFVSSLDKEAFENVRHAQTAMFVIDFTNKDKINAKADGDNDLYGDLWAHALNTPKPFYKNDLEATSNPTGFPDGHVLLVNFLAVPVVIRANVLGLITLANTDHGYSEKDLTAVQRIAEVFALAIHRNEYEQQRLQLEKSLQQAQKMEAIGTLAGGIAHDFNNILGAILGYAEMVQEDCPTGSTMRSDIDRVVDASLRAKELVKQILAFSRQAESEERVLQPALIITEAMKMLCASLPKTIDIQQNIDLDAGLILTDPTQLHQIITNLCTNAFQAMEETGGTLNISLKNKELAPVDLVSEPHVQPGLFVEIAVGDTGPGVSPKIIDKIFDPFYTTKEVGKGTGMGLAIIHGIAKKSGGFVSCQSSPGEGTCFNVYFPVHAAATAPSITEPTSIGLTQTGNERILFIDDEEMLAEMGKTMLERRGYRVTVETNSIEALKIIQNQPDGFDLVITDQTMPGMTGSDLARRILQIRPAMPIILCTGFSNIISEEKAKIYGIREFAMKPLAQKDLAALIRKVLDGEKREG